MNEDFFNIEPVKLENKKHLAFCLEYVNDFDTVGSYKKVYGDEMSDESAKFSAYRVLRRDDVQDFIDYYIWMSVKDSQAIVSDPARTLREIDRMAFSPDYKYPSVKGRMLELRARIQGLLGEDASLILEEQRKLTEKRIVDRRQAKSKEHTVSGGEAEVTSVNLLMEADYRILQKMSMENDIAGNIGKLEMVEKLESKLSREELEGSLRRLRESS